MFVLTYLMIGLLVRQQSVAEQHTLHTPWNLFSTKNSYGASLELWTDQPTIDTDAKHVETCCQPIQVITGLLLFVSILLKYITYFKY